MRAGKRVTTPSPRKPCERHNASSEVASRPLHGVSEKDGGDSVPDSLIRVRGTESSLSPYPAFKDRSRAARKVALSGSFAHRSDGSLAPSTLKTFTRPW